MDSIIERSRGTIRFSFKEPQSILKKNKRKQSLIYLFFSYGSHRFKYSTGYKSCFDDWDFKKQRVKNKIAILNRDEINNYLSDLGVFIKKEYASLSKDIKNVSKELLKHKLDVFTKRVNSVNEYLDDLSFFQVIDKFLSEKENLISIITIRSYKQTQKRLKEFEKVSSFTLSFDTIDMSFYNKFNKFLEDQNYALNTIGKHIKNFKTFLNYALSEGYTSNQRFRKKDFKVKTEITTEIYLTEDEIKQMHIKDLSEYPDLEYARDVFLMGCYTGQRISDYNNLKEEDIVRIEGIEYFKIIQKKNRKYGKEVMCPITKEIREIMDKRHNGNPPKKIEESQLNEDIKKVGELLKFNELVKCEYTRGGKLTKEMIPKHKLIKSHTARRTYCTNKYLAGMSVYDIRLFSGHSTEKEFYKYIRIKDRERALHIVKGGFFNV
jgi:integrase